MNNAKRNNVGEIWGEGLSTSSLPFPFEERDKGSIRVVWEEGAAWRLRLLSRGNEPLALPGEEVLFSKKDVQEAASNNRAIVVVSGPSSGLTSYYHWLTRGEKSPNILAVDLRNAHLRGETAADRVEAIAAGLRHEIEFFVGDKEISLNTTSSADPIEIMIEIAERSHKLNIDALAFRSFEALDDDTATRFFGRIRSLLEHPRRPLSELGVILLGQSIQSLDPEQKRPVSTLRNLSEIYAPTVMRKEEVKSIIEKLDLPADPGDVIQYSGGEPLLVHSLFRLLEKSEERKPTCETLEEAGEFLRKERPPVFEEWVRGLLAKLERKNVAQFVERLLRDDKCDKDANEESSVLTELFIENWIRLNKEESVWEWMSDFRKRLATEALARHYFA